MVVVVVVSGHMVTMVEMVAVAGGRFDNSLRAQPTAAKINIRHKHPAELHTGCGRSMQWR